MQRVEPCSLTSFRQLKINAFVTSAITWFLVIPAKAGIQMSRSLVSGWTPVFTGVTTLNKAGEIPLLRYSPFFSCSIVSPSNDEDQEAYRSFSRMSGRTKDIPSTCMESVG